MSSKNSSKLNVPEAKAAMDKFKMEAASEVGVNLKNGYNGRRGVRLLAGRPFSLTGITAQDSSPFR